MFFLRLGTSFKVPWLWSSTLLWKWAVWRGINPARWPWASYSPSAVGESKSRQVPKSWSCGQHDYKPNKHKMLFPSYQRGTYLSTCLCVLLNRSIGKSWGRNGGSGIWVSNCQPSGRQAQLPLGDHAPLVRSLPASLKRRKCRKWHHLLILFFPNHVRGSLAEPLPLS